MNSRNVSALKCRPDKAPDTVSRSWYGIICASPGMTGRDAQSIGNYLSNGHLIDDTVSRPSYVPRATPRGNGPA